MRTNSHSRILKPVLAVFDFDETLTKIDTFIPFIKFVVGNVKFIIGLIILSPVLISYILRIVPNYKAKEKVMIYFFGGLEVEELNGKAQHYAEKKLDSLLRPDAVEKLKWHQDQGHVTALVSASLEIYLKPWGKRWGFNKVLGTRLEVNNGYLTGRIHGKNCYGEEKVNRIREAFGDLNRYEIYGYGDSKADQRLLDFVDHAYLRFTEMD